MNQELLLQIVGLMRYSLERIRELDRIGADASAWRHIRHLAIKAFQRLLDGEVQTVALPELREAIDDVLNNRTDGGSGSGNWGHEGRPGKLGGSARGGGVKFRQGEKGSYTSEAKKRAEEKVKSKNEGRDKTGSVEANNPESGTVSSAEAVIGRYKVTPDQKKWLNDTMVDLAAKSPEELKRTFSSFGSDWAEKAKDAYDNGNMGEVIDAYVENWASKFDSKKYSIPGAVGEAMMEKGHIEGNQGIANDKKRQVEYIVEQCGLSSSEASSMQESLKTYLGGTNGWSYVNIRAAITTNDENTYLEKVKKEYGNVNMSRDEAISHANKIEKYIQLAPNWTGGTLYRGVSPINEKAEKIISDAKSGKEISFGGFSSWSSDYSYGSPVDWREQGRKNIVFIVSGTKHGTTVAHFNPADEHEVLISGKARWKATDVYERETTTYIECTEL